MRAITKITKTALSIAFAFAIAIACTLGSSRSALAGPEPAVGLYWVNAGDPTTGAGVSAPMYQLLIRSDNGSIYYKSGTANTAWTLIGQSAGGGVTGSGTANAIPKWTATTVLGISATTDDGTTTTIGDALAVPGLTTLGNVAGANIFPTTLAANADDYNPTGLAGAGAIFLSASTPVQLTGLQGGRPGRRLEICDFPSSGATTLTVVNESSASAAANRFTMSNPLGGAVQWPLNGCLHATYNGATSRWAIEDTSFFPALELGGTLDMAGNVISNVGLIGGDTSEFTTSKVDGTLTVAALQGTIIRPTTTGTLNNWAPTGIATATDIFLTPTTTTTITGISIAGMGSIVDGRKLTICDVSATTDLILADENGGSTTGNQLLNVGLTNWRLTSPNTGNGPDCVSYTYDTAFNEWRMTGIGSLDVPTIASFNNITVGGGTINNLGGGIALGTGKFSDTGTPPVPSACGTGAAITGGGMTGLITEGSGATGCVVTFSNPFLSPAATCILTPVNGGTLPAFAVTATDTLTITTAGGPYTYACANH